MKCGVSSVQKLSSVGCGTLLTIQLVKCWCIVLSHQDSAFVELKSLLETFGIMQFYTDSWGAYERHLKPAFHNVGKALHNYVMMFFLFHLESGVQVLGFPTLPFTCFCDTTRSLD